MTMPEQISAPLWQDIYFKSYDGIKLYGRHYPGDPTKRPLLCLANIIQNGRSFEPLAKALSSEALGYRPVYTLDYRGRGRSEHDPNWENYSPLIDLSLIHI